MKYKPIPKNMAMIHLIFAIILFFFSFAGIKIFIGAMQIYIQDKSCNYVLEYAEIVRYEANPSKNNVHVNYITYYEYTDDNGKMYAGIWDTCIEKESEAIAKLGEKVPIYVDHEKQVHKTSEGTNIGAVCFGGIMALISLPLFLNSLIRYILYVIHWYKVKVKGVEEKEE